MDLLIGKTIGLLVVAILVAIAARRLRLPYTVGPVVAGMSLAISHIDLGISLTHDIIFDLILPPLLFEAALNLRWGELQRDAAPILLLSIVGVLISAGVTYLGMTRLLGWPTAPALIFSVLIAATDPVAAIALFKDLGIQGRTRRPSAQCLLCAKSGHSRRLLISYSRRFVVVKKKVRREGSRTGP